MFSKTLSLRFPRKVANEPIVVNLVRDYDLTFNILKATIYPREEGFMVLELMGKKEDFNKASSNRCNVKSPQGKILTRGSEILSILGHTIVNWAKSNNKCPSHECYDV